MARPRNDDDSRRKVYRLRLNEAERAALTAAAAGQGVTPADFLRAAFLGPSRPGQRARPAPVLDTSTVAALSRVGANLNQLARRANSGDLLQPGELPGTLSDIAKCLDRIETMVFAAIEE